MVILHVAFLNNEKFKGPNINVPKNIINESKYAKVALYNCNLQYDIKDNNYSCYSIKEYNSIFALPKPFNNPNIVVFEGVYYIEYYKMSKELKKHNIPYIIVPRCSLTKEAQRRNLLKKIIANNLIFKRFVKNAASVHFLTKNEQFESNMFKFKDSFIVGNGINFPDKYKEYKRDKKGFFVNFIGRVDLYHKGLDYLIKAINEGQEEFRKNKITFNIYGPDRLNSVDKMDEMIREYNVMDLINIYDSVFGKEKEKVLLNTDLFIHTSRLEGQPTAVIEAIGYGVPVFVTPGTNLSEEVKDNNLGFISELDADDIKNNLLKAYEERNNYQLISKNCINYAKNNFDWKTIAKKNIEEYEKIIRRG